MLREVSLALISALRCSSTGIPSSRSTRTHATPFWSTPVCWSALLSLFFCRTPSRIQLPCCPSKLDIECTPTFSTPIPTTTSPTRTPARSAAPPSTMRATDGGLPPFPSATTIPTGSSRPSPSSSPYRTSLRCSVRRTSCMLARLPARRPRPTSMLKLEPCRLIRSPTSSPVVFDPVTPRLAHMMTSPRSSPTLPTGPSGTAPTTHSPPFPPDGRTRKPSPAARSPCKASGQIESSIHGDPHRPNQLEACCTCISGERLGFDGSVSGVGDRCVGKWSKLKGLAIGRESDRGGLAGLARNWLGLGDQSRLPASLCGTSGLSSEVRLSGNELDSSLRSISWSVGP
eukprot:2102719-Rhodomonas_salina.3